jgi:hypothetical protein
VVAGIGLHDRLGLVDVDLPGLIEKQGDCNPVADRGSFTQTRVIGNLFLIALDIPVKIGTGSREDTRDPIDRTRRTLAQKRLIKNRARARIDREFLNKPVEAEDTGAEEITPQFIFG